MLSNIPTYIPSSPDELDSEFTPTDRPELSTLRSKFLFSDIFPGDNPVDLTPGTVSAAVNQVTDHLEGIMRLNAAQASPTRLCATCVSAPRIASPPTQRGARSVRVSARRATVRQ
jgi:hypothetical protein